jgi:cell division inhibitor SulA
MTDIVERMKTALRETMKGVDAALGQVEQSVVPNWNWMREVRERARAVLAEADKLGPAEVVFIDKHDGEKFVDGMIYSSTEKPSEAPWKGESRHQALLIPILDQPKEPT